MEIKNPVLPGFHPDPSICRVGDEFFIATSTFEWFPGVMIYSSRDLAGWTLRSVPLDRVSLLDMAGNPPSGGVWAPCLSHDGDTFYLIYTNVRSWVGSADGTNAGFKDSHNYVVTAPAVEGPWSEPVYLNSSGFDPSLFHDDDGRSWLVNMRWDYRVGHNNFSGIVLQEYDRHDRRLTGPIEMIFGGSTIGFTEAPHLYTRNGWYYLVTAEGGTAYGHAVTVARSRALSGRYELHPQQPFISSVVDREGYDRANSRGEDPTPFLHAGLQKAGHGSMAPITDDEWVMAHLCGRPLPGTYYCPLGRETALQRVEWRDEWPWMADGAPAETVSFPDVSRPEPHQPSSSHAARRDESVWTEHFDGERWALELQSIREPLADRARLDLRPGHLTLYGGESPTSRFRQSVLARRVQAFRWSAETAVEVEPEDFQQFAGMVVRYDDATQLLLRISRSDEGEHTLGILEYDRGVLRMPLGDEEAPVDPGPVELGVDAVERGIQFRWRSGQAAGTGSGQAAGRTSGVWQEIGPAFDPGKLSDDYADPLGFTGTFVGIGAFDTSGRRLPAHFDYLSYRELP
ncbi:MAG: glycoside hydrolase family 43 protein [Alkalispirochaeta sp.]